MPTLLATRRGKEKWHKGPQKAIIMADRETMRLEEERNNELSNIYAQLESFEELTEELHRIYDSADNLAENLFLSQKKWAPAITAIQKRINNVETL